MKAFSWDMPWDAAYVQESFEFGHFYGLGWIDASVRRLENKPGQNPLIGWNNLKIKETQ